MSHPVWVRGLKLLFLRGVETAENVAPRVGAWIETEKFDPLLVLASIRRTPCGCVD